MSDQAVVPKKPLTDDQVLDYTQGKRCELVDDLTANGMPSDSGARAHLLMALDGLDRQALSKKKIASDEKIADSDRQAASVISSIFAKFGNKNPFEKKPVEGEVIAPPSPDLSKLSSTESVPGEMDIGTADTTYDSFTAGRVVAQDQTASQDQA